MKPDPFLQTLPEVSEVPPALLHLHGGPGRYAGRCSVEGGDGWLTKLALRLGRFPPSANDIPVQVRIDRTGQEWMWKRNFNGHTTRSRLTFDRKKGCVCEQMGRLTFWLKPEFSDGLLAIRISRLKVMGLRCPAVLMPRSSTVEWQDEQGRFRFDVSAEMPVFGHLIRYRGWLAPDHTEPYSD